MNYAELYRWDREGAFYKETDKLSVVQLRQLDKQMSIARENYLRATKNYSEEHKQKYSVPYLREMARIQNRLKNAIAARS